MSEYKPDEIIPGSHCIINEGKDLYFYVENRPFINQKCEIIKKTKAGLYQVKLLDGTDRTMSFPKYNIDITVRND